MQLKSKFVRFSFLFVSAVAFAVVAVPGNEVFGQTKTQATATKSADQSAAAKTFVQSFYSWYAPLVDKNKATAESATEAKKSAFSPELYRQLKEDFDAQEKVKDEIVGLDFDPFLNAQDMAPKYVAGKVVAKNDRYLVDVHSVSEGKKSAKADVVPEVALKNGKWVFVNFHYGKTSFPENENLLSVLKALRDSRLKYPVK